MNMTIEARGVTGVADFEAGTEEQLTIATEAVRTYDDFAAPDWLAAGGEYDPRIAVVDIDPDRIVMKHFYEGPEGQKSCFWDGRDTIADAEVDEVTITMGHFYANDAVRTCYYTKDN